MTQRHLLAGAAGMALLAGCAAINSLAVDVSSFGEWPSGRASGSYAFERLPSQQAHAVEAQALEAAAAPALAAAGFSPVAAGATPDVLVQLGARVGRAEQSPWNDPLWWRGGWGGGLNLGYGNRWHSGPWRGPVWGGSLRYESPRYDREVGLLIRDRSSGHPLYEVRASSEGYTSQADELLRPLFGAALAEFPRTQSAPHRVTAPSSGG